MKLADFLKKIEGLDPNTVLCVAEVDDAFGSEVADVEIVSNARRRSPKRPIRRTSNRRMEARR